MPRRAGRPGRRNHGIGHHRRTRGRSRSLGRGNLLVGGSPLFGIAMPLIFVGFVLAFLRLATITGGVLVAVGVIMLVIGIIVYKKKASNEVSISIKSRNLSGLHLCRFLTSWGH